MVTMTRRTLLAGLASAPLLSCTPVAAVAAPLPAAVFVAAHQDDELLSMGSAIAAAVDQGRQTVVICATDGSATAARKTLSTKLGRRVTREQITAYRDAEFTWTVRTGLRATPVLPPPGIRMVDGGSTLAGAEALLRWVAQMWPGAAISTHSPWDTHLDHRPLAVAAVDLQAELGPVRHFVPPYVLRDLRTNGLAVDMPRLSTVRRARAAAAQGAYRLWAPPAPGSTRTDRYFAIGYTSTPRSLDAHRVDPTSHFHAPIAVPYRLLEGLRR